jgi:Tfp pilus assembly protein PilN
VRTATNYAGLAVVAAAVLVIFGLGLGYYLLSSTRGDLTDEHQRLVAERTRLEAEVALLQEYKVLANQKTLFEDVVQDVYAGRTLVSDVLDDLSVAVPENVWFISLNLSTADPGGAYADPISPPDQGIASDSAFAMEGNTDSFPDVALLLVRLRLVESLRGITLVNAGPPIGAVREDAEVAGFSIIATLVNTQSEEKPLPLSKVVEVEVQ